jgi:hypothetical protein
MGEVDFSLYLVTDSTSPVIGDGDLCDIVRRALKGGVTILQYRDKTSDTGQLVETGRRLHAIARERGVPLLINDRVDVALAVGCEGVHLGQDDLGPPSLPTLSVPLRSCLQTLPPLGSCWAQEPSSARRRARQRRLSRPALTVPTIWASALSLPQPRQSSAPSSAASTDRPGRQQERHEEYHRHGWSALTTSRAR